MSKYLTKLCILIISLSISSIVSATIYPPAAEDPIVDGAFSSVQEYRNAHKVLDDLSVGYFYKEHRVNWTVNGTTYPNTITFFDTHYFFDSGYSQLDMFDLNTFEYKWGNTTVTTWVFLQGNNPDGGDALWLDIVGIGSSNYPSGIDDDGGFLVRLNNDPSTDKRWKPGDPRPGDPGWNFADYYGVFAYGGFNNSAYTNGYDISVSDPREIYEWSITMNRIGNGIPGGGDGGDDDNPPAPDLCDPIWKQVTKWKKVCDWNGRDVDGKKYTNYKGWIPIARNWVFMGWDDSMHPKAAAPCSILLPVVNDKIPAGYFTNVTWGARPDTAKYKLLSSTNNGLTWNLIAYNLTGTSYDWPVPVPANNKRKSLVKLIGFDALGMPVCENTSDNFTVEVLRVTDPDGGEILRPGETHNITWRTFGTRSPVAKVELYYTTGGGIWKLITTRSVNTGSHPWTPPYVTSSKCKAKVVLKDATGKIVGSDVSDKVFKIQPEDP